MMESLDNVRIADTSRWQGLINFDTLAAHRVNYVPIVGWIGRVSISWGYHDNWFPRGQVESKRVGLWKGGYHIFYPGEDPKRQCDNYFAGVGPKGLDVHVLDVELSHDIGVNEFADNMQELLEMMDDESGKDTIIYSRANFLNDHVIGAGKSAPEWLKYRYLMMAQWLHNGQEHPGPYSLPRGCSPDFLVMAQTSEKQDGLSMGYESYGADISRLQWDEDRFNRVFLNIEEEPDTTVAELRDDIGEAVQIMHSVSERLSEIYSDK